ncbi:MAG TPA: FAD:protein FMN transferase [Polyangiales bacterium]|nr:FAD:protein FMN transferase [Polyangiales bacterium]
MGTLVSQRAYGITAAHALQRASDEIARLERLWSAFRQDSEVSALAASAGRQPIDIEEDTLLLLAQAARYHAWMCGAFDITVGPLLAVWRAAARRGALPSSSELARATHLVNGRDLRLGPERRAMLERAGQRLDLGAIGKGYAADRCIEVYRSAGLRHALVDLGGNVALLGSRQDGGPYRVGVQAPNLPRGQCVGTLEAADCAIVSSGSYERFFVIDGRRYSHVIDPRSGQPIDNDLSSVTVLAESSTFADALSTACLVLGLERGFTLAETLGADALLIDRAGNLHFTGEMADRFCALSSA